MELKIKISKDEVFEEVKRKTAYLSRTLPGEQFDTAVATDDEEALLEDFWNEALWEICGTLNRYDATIVRTGREAAVTFLLPSNFDAAKEENIGNVLCKLTSSLTAGRWCSLYIPSCLERLVSETQTLFTSLGELLDKRIKPEKI